MRPVVGCWFFLFFCLACASNERSEVQASIATRAAAAKTSAGAGESFVLFSLNMRSDLLRRGGERFFFELLATVAASSARAEGEQARPEEQERHRFGYTRRRRWRT